MALAAGERRKLTSLAEINVTPLVDVMLVLLIIFMVTAPMLETRQGIEIQNPRVEAGPLGPEAEEPLVLKVDEKGRVWLGATEIRPEDISTKMADLLKPRKDKNVYLDGDARAKYGAVVQVMAYLRKVGVGSMGLITKPPEPEPRKDKDKKKERGG